MDELQIYRNAWNTCIEMAKDRGFEVDQNYSLITDNDFKYMLFEKKIDIFAENSDKTRALFFKFVLAPKIKPSTIKVIIDEIKKECEYTNIDLIIILKSKPNNTITKIEKEYTTNIQIMWCKQLQFNVTKHVLVPKHTKCNDEEINELLKTYNLLTKVQLPLISRDDPVIRYYNYKPGDVIKITGTKMSFNPNYEFYRTVK
jgi:DNA-directed RNA polymerase I, II, and III subunit RPABC1